MAVESYKSRLDADSVWAWQEGGLYFEERGAVQVTVRRITERLTRLGVPHAVVGALALFRHGYRRFTLDIDLLVTPVGLHAILENIDGIGLIRRSGADRRFHDIETGVGIDLVVTGEFPGDGRPRPVVFPDPIESAVMIGGLAVIALPKLFDIKLTAGMSDLLRLKHLADVVETIKHLNLTEDFAADLHPSVRPKYLELWEAVQTPDPFDQ